MTIKIGVDTVHNWKSFLKWLPKHAIRRINCASKQNREAIANTINLAIIELQNTKQVNSRFKKHEYQTVESQC